MSTTVSFNAILHAVQHTGMRCSTLACVQISKLWLHHWKAIYCKSTPFLTTKPYRLGGWEVLVVMVLGSGGGNYQLALRGEEGAPVQKGVLVEGACLAAGEA